MLINMLINQLIVLGLFDELNYVFNSADKNLQK